MAIDDKRACASVVAGVLLAALGATGAHAAQAHSHVPVAVDTTLRWPALIDSTLAVHPRSGDLRSRLEEALALERRGSRWLAAAPSFYFSYLSDRPRDDTGQREYEGGVELPFWRAGQRSAVQAVAGSATAASEAARAALRLEVAGLLRGALWDIEAAANALAAARDAVAVAEEIVRVVERRNARGDLSQADVLLARTTLLERQQAEVEAEAVLLDSERGYRSLTGLDRRPASFAEARSEIEDLTEDHPLLELANAEIERARSNRAFIARDARGPFSVTVGPHREYDPFGTVPRDSMTVAVKIPFGAGSQSATQAAQAGRLVSNAESERNALLRRLDLDLHEAEHTLTVLDESLALAADRAAVAEQQLRMAQSAFAQGEIELRELLRVQEATLAARRNLQRLGIEQGRTIAALNQALGATP
jgi:outer membrane protein TolC